MLPFHTLVALLKILKRDAFAVYETNADVEEGSVEQSELLFVKEAYLLYAT